MASQKVEIKMARFENSPWGFRVHGGTDFGAPLTIQKVRKLGNMYQFLKNFVKLLLKFIKYSIGLLSSH